MLLTGTGKLALSAKWYVFMGKTLLTGTVFVRKNSLDCEIVRIYEKNAFDRDGFCQEK